ncbi:tRNA-splicing endonuclease subunit [Thalictrum thalictroides]|uniref:tRNA-splicing endonuclease subunit n=1 Tax=Thalictrum thalictroides TaxID=46969 RepID=A0A7J6VQI9_THATH|nr:tRNA-splicing endonuclease subunit [Thalictrum thalictroides]
MENEESEIYCNEKLNWEVHLQDISGDGQPVLSDKAPKVQFRKHVSKARWDVEMGLAEVIDKKGNMWKTTGIMRGSKHYCSIEETLFLVEFGALLLIDANETILSLKNIYEMIAEEKNGCCWESYKAFKHLKSLGYIVRRHGISWTLKSDKSCSISKCSQGNGERSEASEKGEEYISINNLFGDMQISGLRPAFDVYRPNSKFKVSDPGVPDFVLCLARDPPSTVEIEDLRRRCNGVPVIICNVEHGLVSFFSFTSIELPVLP